MYFLYRYYRGASGAMVAYDVTNRETFTNIQKWLKEIEVYCNKPVPMILRKLQVCKLVTFLYKVNSCSNVFPNQWGIRRI